MATSTLQNHLRGVCFVILVSLLVPGKVFSQGFEWVTNLKGATRERPVKLIQDNDGFLYYAVNNEEWVAHFELPDTTYRWGNWDTARTYIIKLDSNGKYLKSATVKGGRALISSFDLVYDAINDKIIWGVRVFGDSCIFDTLRKDQRFTRNHIYLFEINSDLKLKQYVDFAGNMQSYIADLAKIATASDGGVFIGGTFRTSIRHPGQTAWTNVQPGYKSYIYEFDSNFVLQRNEIIGASDLFGDYKLSALTLDTANRPIVAFASNRNSWTYKGSSGTGFGHQRGICSYIVEYDSAFSVIKMHSVSGRSGALFKDMQWTDGGLLTWGYFDQQYWPRWGSGFYNAGDHQQALVLNLHLGGKRVMGDRTYAGWGHKAVAATWHPHTQKYYFFSQLPERSWLGGVAYLVNPQNQGLDDLNIKHLHRLSAWNTSKIFGHTKSAYLGGQGQEEVHQVISSGKNLYVLGTIKHKAALPPFLSLNPYGQDIFIGKYTDCAGSKTASITSSDTALCKGDSAILSSQYDPKLKYYWYRNGVHTQDSGHTLNVNRGGSYELVINDRGCLDTSSKIVINDYPGLNVSQSPFAELCTNDTSVVLSGGQPAGGYYKGFGVVNDSLFKRRISGPGIFPITYVYQNQQGCIDSAKQNIKVGGSQVGLSPISSFCENSKVYTLQEGYPGGGNYGGHAVFGGKFYPSIAGAGMHTVKYYVQSGTCVDTAYKTVTVDSLPVVTMGSLPKVCESTFSLPLNHGNPSGGSYFGSAVIGSNFYPLVAGAGVHQVGYRYTSSGGCTDTAFANIVVEKNDTAFLQSIPDLCANSPTYSPLVSPAGGVLRVDGFVSTSVNPSNLSLGIHSATYTINNTCRVDSAQVSFRVNAKPNVSVSVLDSLCKNQPKFSLNSGSPSGGIYKVNGATETEIKPSLLPVGNNVLSYIYSDANGCSDSLNKSFGILAVPQVTFDSLPFQCSSFDSLNLSQGKPVGGIYSGPHVSNGKFYPKNHGRGYSILKYSYTDNKGCSDSAFSGITVDSVLQITHKALDSICYSSDSVVLTGALPNGGSYFGSNVRNGKYIPWLKNSGNDTVYYALQTSCGSDTIPVYFYLRPKLNLSLNLPTRICENSSAISLNGAGTPNGGSYTGSGIIGSSFSPSGLSGISQITYHSRDVNGCEDSVMRTILVDTVTSVSVHTQPRVCENDTIQQLNACSPAGGMYSGAGISSNSFNPTGIIADSSLVQYSFTNVYGCEDSTAFFVLIDSVTPVSYSSVHSRGFCEYDQSVSLFSGSPAGGVFSGTGVSGATFNPQLAVVGQNVITYQFTNLKGCRSSSIDSIKVFGQPGIVFTAIPDKCANDAPLSLNNTSPSGGVYSGVGVTGTTFYPNQVQDSSIVSYVYTDSNFCKDTIQFVIRVDSVPQVTFNNWIQVCTNAPSFSLTGGSPQGGTYSGYGVSNGQFNPLSVGRGRIPVTYTVTDLNGCVGSMANAVLVDSLTPVTLTNIPNSICISGNPLPMTFGSPSGGVYSGKGIVNDTLFPQLADSINKITYSFTNGLGCSDSVTRFVAIDSVTPISLTLPPRICENADSLYLGTVSPLGGNFIGSGIRGLYFNPDSLKDTVTISYDFTNLLGCRDITRYKIVVDTLPELIFTPDSAICENADSLVLSPFANQIGGWFTGPGIRDSLFGPSVGVNNYQLAFHWKNNLSGCEDSVHATIRVDTVPIVTLPSLGRACDDSDPVLLSGGSPLGGRYGGQGVGAGSYFVPKIQAPGQYLISYTYEDSRGCSDSAFNSFHLDTIPVVNFSIQSQACENDDEFAMNARPVGGIYSGKGVQNAIEYNPGLAGVGVDTLWYHFTDQYSCKDSAWVVINVVPKPTVLYPNLTGLCFSDSIALIDQATPGGGVYNSPHVDSNKIFKAYQSGPGIYPIKYTYTDSNSCSDSAMQTIEVWKNPIAFAGNDTSFCGSQTIQLKAGPDSLSYLWDQGDTTRIITISAGGSFHLRVKDLNGCEDRDTVVVKYEAECLSINSNSQIMKKIRLFPNPADRFLNIQFIDFESDKAVISVVDNLGAMVMDAREVQLISELPIKLDVSKLSTGKYFLQIETQANSMSTIPFLIGR